MARPWIDTHIHVSDIGRDGVRRERMLDNMLEVLDRCDADLRLIVSCDGPYLGRIARDPASMLPSNRMVHDLVRRAPGRLFGSCTVNPNFPDESLETMRICFEEWDFVQLGEMLQYMMDYRMDSDAVETVLRESVRYGVPVQVHLGTYWHRDHAGSCDGMDHMRDLLRAARRVPEATYVLAHAIGCGADATYVPWADMFLDTLNAYFGEFPDNFRVEIRDFHCPALPRTLRDVPTNRLLAGTDWTTRVGPPFQSYGTMFDVGEADNPFPPGVGSFVSFLRDAGASEIDIDRIGFANARDLYGLDL